jgi:hypothetical protein
MATPHYYLYLEDISGFKKDNLPDRDTSEFISGFLNNYLIVPDYDNLDDAEKKKVDEQKLALALGNS